MPSFDPGFGNCALFASANMLEAGGQSGSYAGVLSSAPHLPRTGNTSPTPPPPSATTAGGLFPLPRPGLYIGYQVERAAPSYATFRALRNEGHATVFERKIWEGNYLEERAHRGEQVRLAGGELVDGPCRLTVDAAGLRTFVPGATPDYERHCTNSYSDFAVNHHATVLRSVTGRRSLSTMGGNFEGIEVTVRTTTRSSYRFHDDASATLQEVAESVVRRLWVAALGFYVEQIQQNRLVVRDASRAWERRDGPRTATLNQWNQTRFFAIEVQNR